MARADRLITAPFLLAVLGTLGIFLSIGMLLPVLPVYAKGPLDTGNVGIGLAVAAASPTALLFQPIAGRLGDRRGRRLLVVAGPLIMAATIASYTMVDALLPLVALRLATGVGEALAFVGFATVVNDLAPEDRRGETISIYEDKRITITPERIVAALEADGIVGRELTQEGFDAYLQGRIGAFGRNNAFSLSLALFNAAGAGRSVG